MKNERSREIAEWSPNAARQLPTATNASSRAAWRFRFAITLVLAAIPLMGPVPPPAARAAEQPAAFSMSIDEFRALSAVDQKALLASVFQHRLLHTRNLHYTALQLVDFVENDAAIMPLGKILKRLNGSRLEHWALADSFRIDSVFGGPDVEPMHWVTSNFDAVAGVARSSTRFKDQEAHRGRIDTKPNRIIREHRYPRWLDGTLQADEDSLPRYLSKYSSEFVIETPTDESTVRVSMPWHYRDQIETRGTRVFTLDPQKGFLPVHGISRWELSGNGARKQWRLDEFSVEQSRLVGDAWMPTKLKWVIDASSVLDSSAVYHITVDKIEAGTVAQEDLEVAFQPGTYVVDAIRGEAYDVGKDGRRTNARPLLGAASLKRIQSSQSESAADGARGLKTWLAMGNLLLIAGAVGIRHVVKRGGMRKKPGGSGESASQTQR